MPLKTDYLNDVFSGNRKYNMITNSDGTVSLVDVTEYSVEGDDFGANDINDTNSAVNIRSIGVIENPSPIKEGDSLQRALLAYNSETEQWERNEFGAVFDGTNLVSQGRISGNFFTSADDITKEIADAMAFATNEVLNPDFENDDENWTLANNAVLDSTHYLTGTQCLKLESADGSAAAMGTQAGIHSVIAGHKYYASVWVYKEDTLTSDTGQLDIIGISPEMDFAWFYDANITAGEWTKLSNIVEAPSDDDAVNLRAFTFSTEPIWVDKFTLVDLTELFGEGEIGCKLYYQDNGCISTATRSDDYYAGWVEDTETAWIGMRGGIDKEYLGVMNQCNAVPGKSGTIRIQAELPEDAAGAKLYRSTAAYAGEGMGNWGELVLDLTDDSETFGANAFLVDDNDSAGLTDGTVYYYKFFPYAGSTYNETTGENETHATAGLLYNSWSFDVLDGSTIEDDTGNDNLTGSNISYSSELIGNGAVFNGTSSYAYADNKVINGYSNQFTFDFWIDPEGSSQSIKAIAGAASWISGNLVYGFQLYLNTSYQLCIRTGTGTTTRNEYILSTALSSSGRQHVTLEFDSGSLKLWIDGVQDTAGGSGDIAAAPGYGSALEFRIGLHTKTYYSTINSYGDMTLDQFKIYGMLSDDDVVNIHNAGAGV